MRGKKGVKERPKDERGGDEGREKEKGGKGIEGKKGKERRRALKVRGRTKEGKEGRTVGERRK